MTPKKDPTPAVNAIAKAPQKVTRAVGIIKEEPPACAERTPNSARNKSELAETAHISTDTGTKRTTTRGKAAPTEKVEADADLDRRVRYRLENLQKHIRRPPLTSHPPQDPQRPRAKYFVNLHLRRLPLR